MDSKMKPFSEMTFDEYYAFRRAGMTHKNSEKIDLDEFKLETKFMKRLIIENNEAINGRIL